MMEERYHVTTQNRFYPDMSNVNKNIRVEVKLISPPTYVNNYLLLIALLHVSMFIHRPQGVSYKRLNINKTEKVIQVGCYKELVG